MEADTYNALWDFVALFVVFFAVLFIAKWVGKRLQ